MPGSFQCQCDAGYALESDELNCQGRKGPIYTCTLMKLLLLQKLMSAQKEPMTVSRSASTHQVPSHAPAMMDMRLSIMERAALVGLSDY